MPADPSKDLLLITGASGRQSSSLLSLIFKEWKNLRLAVRSNSSASRLREQYPHAQVVQVDLCEKRDIQSLFDGVTVCLHIGPTFHPHETQIGYHMIDAAVTESKNGNFKHFILSSVLNSQLRKMMNHDCKRYIEEYIMESGLAYTILQPTTFMDNLPLPMLAQQEKPVFKALWSTDVPFSFIALQDLGAVMERVLYEREKHFYAQYPLVSTRSPLTLKEVMGIVSEKLGKQVEVDKVPYTEAVEMMCKRLWGEEVEQRGRDAAQRMILFYDFRGLVGNPNVLEWVLGRRGMEVGEWVQMKVEESTK